MLGELGDVTFHEWVEDYADLLKLAQIGLFLDARAGGMKNRVLQALAAARPVVATQTALEGLSGKDGESFFRVHSNEEAFERLCSLAQSPESRLRMGKRARELVQARYTQSVTGEAWECLYEEARELKSMQTSASSK